MKKHIVLLCIILLHSCSSTQSNNKDQELPASIKEANVVRVDLVNLEHQCREQDLTTALKNLSAQYINYKNDPSYWNVIGACFLNDMKPLKARLFFLRALEEDKSFAPALNNLGVVYWQMDKHYEALSYLKRAEQIDRNGVAIKYNLAKLYSWYGLHKSSNEKFSDLDSNVIQNQDYNYIATNQAMLGQFENAINSFRATKQIDSRFQAVYAYALKNIGKDVDATTEWKQAKVNDGDPLKWLWILGD